MHIHNNPMSSQMPGLHPTQGAQQAAAARREALSVRKKLTDFGAAEDSEDVSRVSHDSNAESDSGSRQKKQDPQSEEEFKSVYFSFKV